MNMVLLTAVGVGGATVAGAALQADDESCLKIREKAWRLRNESEFDEEI